ncbi:adenosylmethionine--8-amino-7-oxononanoate transaminase [Piscicoccus intestinalis]|uniref:adenosylmethionine--8-amino-7-oxononanoate transaminase n=1 Tax=Piscicoccus intestinalis TaxID=746033 RepID=UPI000A07030D|nr:adenosylmethionine--8-amino-7-oxononanoate transaminase [Piscicoccus intestinalis]
MSVDTATDTATDPAIGTATDHAIDTAVQRSGRGAAGQAGPRLIARDRGLVWHPYAPLDGPAPYAVRSARGVRLELEAVDGAAFDAIDAMSSWWSVIHGYQNQVLDNAIRERVGEFSHVMFGGLTHEPAVALAERLVALSPSHAHDSDRDIAHVFFADSGSVSMEVALKLAVQYQAARGRRGRGRFLALRGGYHGDTLGAMSVCDPVDGMHAAFPALLPRHEFLPRPPAARLVDGRRQRAGVSPVIDGVAELRSDPTEVEAWITQLEATVAAHSDTLAALVAEPILQGAGGMHVWAPECLAAMRRVADDHGLLLLLDEIATGFGRTGKLFASEWAGVAPDIRCVGKALTGGYLTLAATTCTREVGAAITASEHRALLHGPTFMANPLATSAALASLGLVQEHWARQVPALQDGLRRALAPAAALDCVHEVRVLGGVGVVQLTAPVDVPAVTRAALERGVWVRPFRDLVYTMPPYVSTEADLATIGAAVVGAIEAVHEGRPA